MDSRKIGSKDLLASTVDVGTMKDVHRIEGCLDSIIGCGTFSHDDGAYDLEVSMGSDSRQPDNIGRVEFTVNFGRCAVDRETFLACVEVEKVNALNAINDRLIELRELFSEKL